MSQRRFKIGDKVKYTARTSKFYAEFGNRCLTIMAYYQTTQYRVNDYSSSRFAPADRNLEYDNNYLFNQLIDEYFKD